MAAQAHKAFDQLSPAAAAGEVAAVPEAAATAAVSPAATSTSTQGCRAPMNVTIGMLRQAAAAHNPRRTDNLVVQRVQHTLGNLQLEWWEGWYEGSETNIFHAGTEEGVRLAAQTARRPIPAFHQGSALNSTLSMRCTRLHSGSDGQSCLNRCWRWPSHGGTGHEGMHPRLRGRSCT